MIFKRLLSSLRNVETAIYRQPVPKENDLIIVAMSGGVDSSVCAALYSKAFSNVRGIFMQNWSSEAKCSETDWKDAQKVADHLKIPCERVNFERDYWESVFNPMVEGYQNGITPNPDVNCNKYIKFGRLVEHLSEVYGEENKRWWLVTGHYARVMEHKPTDQVHLLRGSYLAKDQSFYLSSLPKNSLNKILLPIGHFTKPEIREMAKQFELPTASRPDSQGLCFVSQKGTFKNFLNEYIEPNPGNIITEDGTVHGKHGGLWHATVGQKSGISMPQGDPKYEGKWFVSEKRYDTNELVIVRGGDNPKLFKNVVEAKDWTWFGGMLEQDLPDVSELTIQFRSLQKPITLSQITIENQKIRVNLKEEQKGIAEGQALVLYHGERVLGVGVITSTKKL